MKFYFLISFILLFCLINPLYSQDSSLEKIDRNLQEAWKKISSQIPEDRKFVLVVPPFRDEKNGILFLGEYCAGKLQDIIIRDKKKITLVDRQKMDLLMKESETWIQDIFEGKKVAYRSPTLQGVRSVYSPPSEGELNADAFVLGEISDRKETIQIHLTLKMAANDKAPFNAVFETPKDEELQNLLVYVQRPKKTMLNAPEKQETVIVPSLSLRFMAIATEYLDKEQKEYKRYIINEQASLKHKDTINISFTPLSDCWVYVLYYSSQGEWASLFPHPQIRLKNYCLGNVNYWLPDPDFAGADRFYELDEVPGKEIIYIIACYEPIKDLELLIQRLNEKGEKPEKEMDQKFKSAIEDFKKKLKLESGKVQIREGFRGFRISNLNKEEKLLEGDFKLVKCITIQHR